jgi:hypothetical protein
VKYVIFIQLNAFTMIQKGIRTIILLVVGFSLFYVVERWVHKFQRPWAYDDDQPLLLGKWEGSFNDPDGVAKKISIEVIEPEMKEWHNDKVHSRRSFDESDEFKGFATITSKLGIENDRIVGLLDGDDIQLIHHINFVMVDEDKHIRESFNTSYTDGIGSWHSDEMKISLAFVYKTKTGSSYSASDDPRFDMKIPVVLHRVKD